MLNRYIQSQDTLAAIDGKSILPEGFNLAAPDKADGLVKMWLTGNRFYADLWSFFGTNKETFTNPKKNIVCLKRGAGAHVTVIGNGSGRKDIHTMRAGSYDKDGVRNDKVMFYEPIPSELSTSADGEDWVFIDDLSDTGNTILAIRERWPKAEILTVYAKPQGKEFPDGFYLEIKDIWLVFPGEKPWTQFVPFQTTS